MAPMEPEYLSKLLPLDRARAVVCDSLATITVAGGASIGKRPGARGSTAAPRLRNRKMKRTAIAATLAASAAISLPLLSATAQSSRNNTDPWCRQAVIYEIYPQSFQDSDGDGVGD